MGTKCTIQGLKAALLYFLPISFFGAAFALLKQTPSREDHYVVLVATFGWAWLFHRLVRRELEPKEYAVKFLLPIRIPNQGFISEQVENQFSELKSHFYIQEEPGDSHDKSDWIVMYAYRLMQIPFPPVAGTKYYEATQSEWEAESDSISHCISPKETIEYIVMCKARDWKRIHSIGDWNNMIAVVEKLNWKCPRKGDLIP